jgi:hypothetical protein
MIGASSPCRLYEIRVIGAPKARNGGVCGDYFGIGLTAPSLPTLTIPVYWTGKLYCARAELG